MNTLLNSWHPRLIALAAADSDGAHDTNHLHRVWRNATLLLDDYPEADALVVLAGCYLHDLVNLPKNDPERHLASRKAALLASRELAALGFPADKLAAVAHAIESHSYSAGVRAETIGRKSCRTPTVSTRSARSAWRACFTRPAAWAPRWPTSATRWRWRASWMKNPTRSTTSTPSWRRCRPRCRPPPAAAWPMAA